LGLIFVKVPLTKHLSELEIAEQKLKEAIEFVNEREKKWKQRLVEKLALQQRTGENRNVK
jgi:hypothetical protein